MLNNVEASSVTIYTIPISFRFLNACLNIVAHKHLCVIPDKDAELRF